MSPTNEPKVPNGPTAAGASPGATGGPKLPPPLPPPPAGPGTPPPGPEGEEDKGEKKNAGGRRPYDEVLEENRQLGRRLHELVAAALPFTGIPDDQNKKPDETLYVLNRQGRETKITPGHIRALRAAVGLI
jgi:hypothetical protein